MEMTEDAPLSEWNRFDNLTAAESTSTHGNEASFETVVEKTQSIFS